MGVLLVTIGKSSRIRRALMAIVIFALSFFMNFTFGLLRVAILLVFLIVFLFSARMVCEWDARDRNSLGWGFIFGNSLNLGLFLGGSAKTVATGSQTQTARKNAVVHP